MKYVNLNELCDINIGKTPSRSKNEYWGKGKKWLAISDLKEKYICETKEEITDLAIEKCNMKLVPKDTVIMSFKLSIGKLGIVQEEMFTNEAIANFPIKNKSLIIPEFLYYALNTVNFNNTDRAVMGATLNKAKLNTIKIPYCEISSQKKIVNILNSAQELVDKRKKQIEELDLLVKSKFIEMFGDPVLNPKGWETHILQECCTKITDGTHDTPQRLQ
ncbi:restriction endonuclease subunit S, partial [Clostridium perfringens]|uniref:restriction endonuclease subunit S n=1 Tax=Clostridium perfringens TaxID=1502 RepID=UPI003F41DC71